MKHKNLISIITLGILILTVSGLALAQDTFTGQFKTEEMFEYKPLDNYNEAPDLKKLVESGDLPPVEERLPKNPRVIKKNIMTDGIGNYGGVWRDTFAVPVESWNWGAGHTQGYFGINQIVQEPLIKMGPSWMLESPNPSPNLATDWEWSEDGKTLTMNLVEGAKWSDGEPFTADDVVFTYENYILDDNIPSWVTKAAWEYGGELTELEKVDDSTIKWHFGVSYPVHAFMQMDYLDFSVVPKHVYDNFHPEFNEDATYDDLLNATPPEDLPAVVMGPWVPVRYEPSKQLVMQRNPYYWQVDEAGNQLPYLNEVWFNEAESGDARTMNVISGEGDRSNLENPSTFSMVKQASNEEDAHFNIRFGPFAIGYHLQMNLSKYLGADSDRDNSMRELFRNIKFRQALSQAIDRAGVAEAAFPGPLTRPWYGGYPSGSVYYEDELITKYEYNPSGARELLQELGFEDTDDDGILNWPSNYELSGNNFNIELIVGQDQAAAVDAAEALVPLFRKIGIDLKVKVLKGTIASNRIDSGNFEMTIGRQDSVTPFVHMSNFGPINASSPGWHQTASEDQRDLLPFEQEIKDLMEKSQTTQDTDERLEIFQDVLSIYTENVYSIGVYEVRRGLALAKRLKNVQPDIPVYYYNWLPSGIPIQMVWSEEDEKISPRFTENIPTSRDYQDRSWQK